MRDMSSDGAIDKPRSARLARGEDRGAAGIALAVLLVLAIIATIVMVFSENPVWMRIGTLAALWAAFIGAFLVARYRRQAASEAARVRDLHTVYELQLEREISARREHELVVEKDLRDSIRAETSDSVNALRHEIAALREQLGQLGVTLPEDRFAVGGHGPAGELGAGSSLPSVPSERVAPRRRASETPGTGTGTGTGASTGTGTGTGWSGAAAGAGAGAAAASASSTASSAASGVSREATPSTERTDKLSPVAAEKEWARETGGGQRRPAVRPVTRSQPAADSQKSSTTPMPAVSDTAQSDQAQAGSTQARQAQSESTQARPTQSRSAQARPAQAAPTHHAAPEQAEQKQTEQQEGQMQADEKKSAERKPATQTPAESEQSAPKSRHGDGGGTSVADLMARLGGDDAPSGGRRRRRSED